jgi:predicted AAA+ superfamily ATPase
MAYITRQLEQVLKKQLDKYPILAVTGPRQSGKTTLLEHLFPDYAYVSLENENVRSFAVDDPVGFLKKYPGKVIFDEVQRAPGLFSYLQTEVDRSGQMGQFILSGSQNFHLLSNITQSLAGRVALFRLLPLDFAELHSGNYLPQRWTQLAWQGAYPALFSRQIEPPVFYHNYIETYLNRDVTELSNIRDMHAFRRFLSLCAGRTGQLLNLANLARDCDITQPTAKAWLSILESSYILFLLYPYHKNYNKRIIKTPKLYFYDTGLACFLLGIRKPEDLEMFDLAGNVFETLVIADFIKRNQHQYLFREYWFWRDSNGNEIDLLTKTGLSLDIFEIKSTQTLNTRLFAGLDYFTSVSGEKIEARTLIYGGNESQNRTNYSVIAWTDLWQTT